MRDEAESQVGEASRPRVSETGRLCWAALTAAAERTSWRRHCVECILKPNDSLERMVKERRHKIKKPERKLKVDHTGHLYSRTLILEATFPVFEIQHNG